MNKKFVVVNGFLDTVGYTILPVWREPGGEYPPDGVEVPKTWLTYLKDYRTKAGEPILREKSADTAEVEQ